jgi:hypothetical protein
VEKSAEPFLFPNSQKSAAHSSRTLLRGGYQIPAKKSRGKTNPFPPAKIVLLCLVRIAFRPATLPEYLYGQNPKKKNVLSILRKIHLRENQKKQGTFFLFGVAE